MQNQPTILAGERTHGIENLNPDPSNEDQSRSHPAQPNSKNCDYQGKSAEEWFRLHEVMREDFRRVLEENGKVRETLRMVTDERNQIARAVRSTVDNLYNIPFLREAFALTYGEPQ